MMQQDSHVEQRWLQRDEILHDRSPVLEFGAKRRGSFLPVLGLVDAKRLGLGFVEAFCLPKSTV